MAVSIGGNYQLSIAARGVYQNIFTLSLVMMGLLGTENVVNLFLAHNPEGTTDCKKLATAV